MRTMLLLLLVCASLARAEELVPELAAPAQLRETQTDALDSQRKMAVEAAKAVYLASLDAADKTAMTDGKVLNVAGIARERDRVQKGEMPSTLPTDLPRNLDPSRRNYLRSLEKIETDFDKRQLAVDADYLRKLASLQFKATSNPTLAAQISSEKQKLATGMRGPITDTSVGIENTRWKKIGASDVWEFKNGLFNGVWRYDTPERDKLRIIWNEKSSLTLTLGHDGKTLLEGGKPVWELMKPVAH